MKEDQKSSTDPAHAARQAPEAARLLAPGVRYAVHDLAYRQDRDPTELEEARRALSRTIKVGARPLTVDGWIQMLTDAGLEVTWTGTAPMRLLEPSRLLADEGLVGTLRILRNARRVPGARDRLRSTRQAFRLQSEILTAVTLVARKPDTTGTAPADDA